MLNEVFEEIGMYCIFVLYIVLFAILSASWL